MNLHASDGQVFALRVLGYQFPPGLPHGPTGWHDRNWLNVRIEVVHSQGRWQSTDPSLLTAEVLELADWLDEVANGKVKDGRLQFIEPNLRFSVGNNALRVHFELESRPSWAKADRAGMNDLSVEFPLSEVDLPVAAADLRRQVEGFPMRAAD